MQDSKLLIIGALVLVGLLMTGLAITGRLATGRSKTLVHNHRLLARTFLTLITILVIFIEIGVRIKGGLHTIDALFVAHLCFAAPLLVIVILLNTRLTGEKSRSHKLLAYGVAMTTCAGMIITGIPLTLRL